jgi:hypothetical protein
MHSIAGDFILQQGNPSCQIFEADFFIRWLDNKLSLIKSKK